MQIENRENIFINLTNTHKFSQHIQKHATNSANNNGNVSGDPKSDEPESSVLSEI